MNLQDLQLLLLRHLNQKSNIQVKQPLVSLQKSKINQNQCFSHVQNQNKRDQNLKHLQRRAKICKQSQMVVVDFLIRKCSRQTSTKSILWKKKTNYYALNWTLETSKAESLSIKKWNGSISQTSQIRSKRLKICVSKFLVRNLKVSCLNVIKRILLMCSGDSISSLKKVQMNSLRSSMLCSNGFISSLTRTKKM